MFYFVFAGLSLIPASQFVAQVSTFRLPIVGILSLVAIITTTHCTVHHHAQVAVVWASACATYLYYMTGTDMFSWSVGQSVSRSVSQSVGRSTFSHRPR